MLEKRLTFDGDTIRLSTLTFGEVLITTKTKLAKVFDPKNGYLDLKGVKFLLTEEESEEISNFLAMGSKSQTLLL